MSLIVRDSPVVASRPSSPHHTIPDHIFERDVEFSHLLTAKESTDIAVGSFLTEAALDFNDDEIILDVFTPIRLGRSSRSNSFTPPRLSSPSSASTHSFSSIGTPTSNSPPPDQTPLNLDSLSLSNESNNPLVTTPTKIIKLPSSRSLSPFPAFDKQEGSRSRKSSFSESSSPDTLADLINSERLAELTGANRTDQD